MLDTPEILTTRLKQTAVIHLTIPQSEVQTVMGPAFNELMAVLASQRIVAAGAMFSHHLKMSPALFDFEFGFPVDIPITASGRVKPSHLPATLVARAIYVGDYKDLHLAWREFDQWILANGYTPADDLWESYLKGAELSPDPAKWWTELTRPLVSKE